MTRNEYISILKTTAIQILKKQLLKYIISKVPFLGFRALNPIIAYFVEKLVVYIVNESEMRLFFVYADFRVAGQANAYVEAMDVYNQNKTVENEKVLLDAFTKFGSLVL